MFMIWIALIVACVLLWRVRASLAAMKKSMANYQNAKVHPPHVTNIPVYLAFVDDSRKDFYKYRRRVFMYGAAGTIICLGAIAYSLSAEFHIYS